MSINQITIDELVRATTVVRRLADFSDVVGKWEPDAALDEFLQSQRTIDESDWA